METAPKFVIEQVLLPAFQAVLTICRFLAWHPLGRMATLVTVAALVAALALVNLRQAKEARMSDS
jgi:hypothetical protein